MSCDRIGILVGGGPAPGTNGVIAAVAIEGINRGCTVLGIHDGFEWLAQHYTDEQHELTIAEVSRIHFRGGTILGTSRADAAKDEESLRNTLASLRKLGIEGLIAIGGDDVLRSSAAVERASEGDVAVVFVPKTIDNDVWLPVPVPTLGYETARQVGVQIVQDLMEDARTTGRWYFAVTMGRPTGHLTLGIGKAAGATVTVIPEEFRERTITLADIADVIEGSIIKRRATGRDFGVAVLAEALTERMSPDEIRELEDVDRDAQGNIRVTEIDLGRKVKNVVQKRLEARGIKVTIVDKTVGYELRCAPPIPFDAEYARDLGYAAVNHLLDGGRAAIITLEGGAFRPVPFADAIDPATGRGRQRFVDIDTESYQVAREYMVRIGPKDFEDERGERELAAAGGMAVEELRRRFGRLTTR
jgi:ATP-dependent phosphofructokinase / diphosphate-dependent phosphofructokinase